MLLHYDNSSLHNRMVRILNESLTYIKKYEKKLKIKIQTRNRDDHKVFLFHFNISIIY